MMTNEEFKQISQNALANIATIFPQMISHKQTIQREIINQLTQQEVCDIKDCRLNENVVDKLARLGYEHYCNDQRSQTLYCIVMAIGTIIKEYEWGNYYVSQEGLYKLAIKIQEYETI